MKKLAFLMAAVMLAACLSACSDAPAASSAGSASSGGGIVMEAGNVEEHTVEAIQARGKLVVTTEAGYAPFEFLDEEGNIVGLDASLAQALADDLGVELDMQNIAFDSVVTEVQAGNADMAIAGLTPNAERKQSVDMSELYYGGGQCMLVLAENAEQYSTKESFDGEVDVYKRQGQSRGRAEGPAGLSAAELWPVRRADGVPVSGLYGRPQGHKGARCGY